MALERMAATSSIEEMLQVIDRDGGLIVEGLFPREVIARMREDVLGAAKRFEPGAATQGLGEAGKEFVGHNTVRFSSLGKLSDAYFDMLDNPVYASLADAVLLPHCGSYWVNTGQAMLIGPESPAQGLHRDCDNWPAMSTMNWPDGPELTLSTMIALDEVTEELGATRVIPGSHRWDDYADRGTPESSVPAEMQPGDALVYTGKVVHGGGANQTPDHWRLAMHLSFVLGWLVPEESSAIDYSDEELADKSERVQRLLGHRSYDPRPHFGGGLWLRHVDQI
jgi:ectoine hydroxylase-related dioxygenase (phytanoyl-CoA dioxygenase family)